MGDVGIAARSSAHLWRGQIHDEEGRAYLQARLVVLSKLMFWSFLVFLAFLTVIYMVVYPDLRIEGRDGLAPELNDEIFVMSSIGIALLAGIWRGLLLRRTLTVRQLQAIDVLYSVGTGTVFAASGAMAYDLRSSAYTCLVYACLMVLLRAIVVPSTGKRTAVIGIVTCLPMTAATVVVVYLNDQFLPGPAYVAGGILVCAMSILLAMVSSNILYGLRRQVTEAMQLGQYTLDGKIGEGGNGAVYRARHALLRRPTAIKLMLPDRIDGETLDRFEREVQLMSLLTHANTVAVYDYGRSPDGIFYYAMEYLDGIDLEKLVMRFGAQPADRVVAILIQACGALQEAHKRGLIHRDIKPANIILCERGDVPDVAKVVDFGLVTEIGLAQGQSARGALGTPAYMAPESVTDPDKVGHAVDIYALGCVAYYLVTGKRVFTANTSIDVCVMHVTATPLPPSHATSLAIPPRLEEIILRCLAKRPEDRPASASELAQELRTVPLGTAWTDPIAIEWWSEFRRLAPVIEKAARSKGSITIDLAQRRPSV